MPAAITQIRDAVMTLTDGHTGAGVKGYLERSSDDAVMEVEMPCWVLRALAFEMEREQGSDTMWWEGLFVFDIYVDAGEILTITEQHSEIACDIVARVAAGMEDPAGLGRLCQDFDPKQLSAEEDATVDQGGVTLTFFVRFQTRASDWREIIPTT